MTFDYKDLGDFISKFNISTNAIEQRELVRWNGRSFRRKENLAEHTHLVVACAIELIDYVCSNVQIPLVIDKYKIVKAAMLHDSLELFRGDILSNTKDDIPGLRKIVDDEEEEFMSKILLEKLSPLERDIVHLADLKACYMYIEGELQFPCNDYTKNMYIETKKRYDGQYRKFCKSHCIKYDVQDNCTDITPQKGYEYDAGVDVICIQKCTFLPMSTTVVNTGLRYTPEIGKMGMLCARTSAAKKGLSVAMCPIDTDYEGDIYAIVHNVSNDIIEYDVGQSFCQFVIVPIQYYDNVYRLKKKGRRDTSNFGGTDK